MTIQERLLRKVQRFPAQGGAGISASATDGLGNPVETKSFSYITDDGYRLANPDGPEAAAKLDKYEEALRKCREKFDFYEQLHRMKCTAEGDEKADRNREMVVMIDETLGSSIAREALSGEPRA